MQSGSSARHPAISPHFDVERAVVLLEVFPGVKIELAAEPDTFLGLLWG